MSETLSETLADAAVDVPSGLPASIPTPGPGDPRLARLSLNQRTTANWSLREAIDGTLAAGLGSIGLWREPVAEVGLATAVECVQASGLRVSSLCRGGFFTAADPAARRAAHEENVRAIEETAALGAPTLVLVPGGLPAGSKNLAGARQRAAGTRHRRAVPGRRSGRRGRHLPPLVGTGDVEVEIFNAEVWAAPGADVLATMSRRYVELVEPWL
jgi:hypothetical protein